MENLFLSGKETWLRGPAMPPLNYGYWNPSLHPRGYHGQFIYTDGGLHGRSPSTSPKKTDSNIVVPPHPANADVDANMRLMRLTADLNPLGKLLAFRLLVQTDGPWDYKNQPKHGANPQYDAFGNFNYGATGTALGLDSYTLQNEAGRAQPKGPNGEGKEKTGMIGIPQSGIPPYGDRPQDNYWVRQGIAYAHQKGY
jgi:hypothetical protein